MSVNSAKPIILLVFACIVTSTFSVHGDWYFPAEKSNTSSDAQHIARLFGVQTNDSFSTDPLTAELESVAQHTSTPLEIARIRAAQAEHLAVRAFLPAEEPISATHGLARMAERAAAQRSLANANRQATMPRLGASRPESSKTSKFRVSHKTVALENDSYTGMFSSHAMLLASVHSATEKLAFESKNQCNDCRISAMLSHLTFLNWLSLSLIGVVMICLLRLR